MSSKRWVLPPETPLNWPAALDPRTHAHDEVQGLQAWVRMLQGNLERIAQAHSKRVGEGGLTSGRCGECDWVWPCPTYTWATTTTRNPAIDCWDPNDDAV